MDYEKAFDLTMKLLENRCNNAYKRIREINAHRTALGLEDTVGDGLRYISQVNLANEVLEAMDMMLDGRFDLVEVMIDEI